MWSRILAVLRARNREFYRDRAGLGWNIMMPILMVFGVAFIFGSEPADLFKIGVLTRNGVYASEASPLLTTRHVLFVPLRDAVSAVTKVEHQQLDLLLDLRGAPGYWVNEHSARGYLAERLLQAAYAGVQPLPRRPSSRANSGKCTI